MEVLLHTYILHISPRAASSISFFCIQQTATRVPPFTYVILVCARCSVSWLSHCGVGPFSLGAQKATQLFLKLGHFFGLTIIYLTSSLFIDI